MIISIIKREKIADKIVRTSFMIKPILDNGNNNLKPMTIIPEIRIILLFFHVNLL